MQPATPNQRKAFKITSGRSLSKASSPKHEGKSSSGGGDFSPKSYSRQSVNEKLSSFKLSKKSVNSSKATQKSLDLKVNKQSSKQLPTIDGIDDYINQYIVDQSKHSVSNAGDDLGSNPNGIASSINNFTPQLVRKNTFQLESINKLKP